MFCPLGTWSLLNWVVLIVWAVFLVFFTLAAVAVHLPYNGPAYERPDVFTKVMALVFAVAVWSPFILWGLYAADTGLVTKGGCS